MAERLLVESVKASEIRAGDRVCVQLGHWFTVREVVPLTTDLGARLLLRPEGLPGLVEAANCSVDQTILRAAPADSIDATEEVAEGDERESCGITSTTHGPCWLPPGHQGDHEAMATANRWPRADRSQIKQEGFVSAELLTAERERRERLEAALQHIEDILRLFEPRDQTGHRQALKIAKAALAPLPDRGEG